MKRVFIHILCVTLLLACARPDTARAWLYYPDDATIDDAPEYLDGVVIGYDDDYDFLYQLKPTSPTIHITDGATLTGAPVFIFNGSTVNMDGGYVNAVYAYNSSSLNVSADAKIDVLSANNFATVNISGVSMYYGINLNNSTILGMSGGDVGIGGPGNSESDCTFHDNSTAIITGGNIHGNVKLTSAANALVVNANIGGTAQASNQSTFSMTGGSVGGGVAAYDAGTVFLHQGNVTGNLFADGATAEADDTTLGEVLAYAGTTTLNNTTVNLGMVINSAVVKVNGGTITGDVNVFESNSPGPADKELVLDGGVTVNGNLTTRYNFATVAIKNADLIGDVSTYDNTSVGLLAGSITGRVSTYDQSTYTQGGGTVAGDINCHQSSSVSIAGGIVLGTVYSDGASSGNALIGVRISGGTIGGIGASGSGRVRLEGGTVGSGNFEDYGFLDMAGGTVTGTVQVHDAAAVDINGGSVANISVDGSATAFVDGGVVTGSITAHDNGAVQLTSGNVNGSLSADGYSTIYIPGGRAGGDVQLHQNAYLALAGGTVGGNLEAHDFVAVTMTDGYIVGGVTFHDHSSFAVSGGHIGGAIKMLDESTITIGLPSTPPGGDDRVASFPAASRIVGNPFRFPISHDVFAAALYLDDDSTLEVDGINLTDTLIDPDAGGEYSEYQLSGELDDGTPLPNGLLLYVENGTGASFQLINDAVPEPGTKAMLPMGLLGFGLIIRRRWAQRPRGHGVVCAGHGR